MDLLLIVTIIITLLSLALMAFRFGKAIFFGYLSALAVLALFLAPFTIKIFGFVFLFGELIYATLFFSTDVIAEHWGKKAAQELVWLIIAIIVIIGLLQQMIVFFTPVAGDFIQPYIKSLLEVSSRIVIAALIMFAVEQHFDIWWFHKIKTMTRGKKLWLRNCGSTLTTQLIDVLIFYPIAFYGIHENLWQMMIAAYIFKICMVLLDTPFMYLSYKVKKSL